MRTAFHYAARSHVGLVRSENQDSGYAGPHLLVVADGMGGHAGGDVASSIAIGRLVELDGASIGGREASDELAKAIRDANTEIGRLVDHQPELRGMGTTVTAILRARNTLILAHIGDSRAYLLRGERFAQLTHDHSFVQTLIDEGRITAEEAAVHPQRSLVTRVLTGQVDDEPDVGAREASLGDRLLICSDGLSGFVGADTIEDILRSGDGPAQAAEVLIDLALKAGAPDNVTVVVADVVDLAATTPSTQHQVVGAASMVRGGTRAIPVSPAEKAAELSRSRDDDDDDVTLAEEGGSRTGKVLRVLGASLAALLILGGGTYAAYGWTQDQLYVGAHQGKVTIFRGVAQTVGPWELSSTELISSVDVEDLPQYFRSRVERTVTVDSRERADQLVDSLREQAQSCEAARGEGRPCNGDDGESPTQEPSTTTSSDSSTSGDSSTSSDSASASDSPSESTTSPDATSTKEAP